MSIVKFGFLIVLLIVHVYCDENEEKVAKVTQFNSSVQNIQYTNNGGFMLPSANTSISTYDYPQMIGQCGGIFRNTQNLIESPKFISARPICNLRCEYQIISPYICENEFHVQFLNFSLDASSNCERDRVIINYSDILCGNVLGVKKYRTIGGVLNITFWSDGWDSVGKGFKLLITRLPCVDDVMQNQTIEVKSSMPELNDDDKLYNVNASYVVSDLSYENQHPIYGVPSSYDNSTDVELNNRQDIPVLPLPTPTMPPIYPPVTYPPVTYPPVTYPPPILPPVTYPPPIFPPVTLPPPILPQCCRNVYNQERFLMLSQGFPTHNALYNDCIFVIHKSSLNACRLRVHFKYFLLDDIAQQQGQLGCMNNFIEIDGQRICGCKTNFVYETQWGLEPKIIRLRTIPGRSIHPQGFIFDIEQLNCPFKIQSAPIRQKRTIITKKLLLHPHLWKSILNGQHHFNSIQPPLQPLIDPDESFRAKFYQTNPAFINPVCSLNYLKLLQLKIESFGILKHFCLPLY